MQQVIQIDQFGRPRSLRMPVGRGIDLRVLGTAKMRRISEIELIEKTQKYGIFFKSNRTQVLFEQSHKNEFETYDEAVAKEVEFVNSLLKKGEKA